MQKRFFLLLTAALGVMIGNVSAQTTNQNKRNSGSTSTTAQNSTASNSKVDKTLDNANRTMDNTTQTADKAKKTVEDFSKLFKPKTPKTPNESFVVIPNIEYEDENLELLRKTIEDHKDVKKATVDYEAGTATITVVVKGKEKSEFWSEMPKTIKELFKMSSKKDNNIIVSYTKPEATAGK